MIIKLPILLPIKQIVVHFSYSYYLLERHFCNFIQCRNMQDIILLTFKPTSYKLNSQIIYIFIC